MWDYEEGIFRSAIAHAQSPLEDAEEGEGDEKEGENWRDWQPGED